MRRNRTSFVSHSLVVASGKVQLPEGQMEFDALWRQILRSLHGSKRLRSQLQPDQRFPQLVVAPGKAGIDLQRIT